MKRSQQYSKKMTSLNYHFRASSHSFFGPHANGFQRNILLDATQGRLVRPGPEGLRPELIHSWESRDQGKLWRFHLTPGLRFHSGRAVSAEDLEFSFILPLISKYRTPEHSVFEAIRGASRIQPGTTFRSGMVEGLRVISSTELAVELETAIPDFLMNIALKPTCSIFPAEELFSSGQDLREPAKTSGAHLSWKRWPIGAGRFRIQDTIADGTEIRLERVGPHTLGSVNLLRMTVGEQIPLDVDILDNMRFDNQGLDRSLSKIILPVPFAIYGVYLNYLQPIVRDLRFRRAIQMALDPSDLLEFFPEGKVNPSIMPLDWPQSEFRAPNFNPAQARILFAELAKDFDLTSVAVSSRYNQAEPAWVKKIRSQLRAVGLPLAKQDAPDGALDIGGFGPCVASAKRLFSLFREGSGWVAKLDRPDHQYAELLSRLTSSELEPSRALLAHFYNQAYSIPLIELPVSYWIRDSRKISLGHQDSDIAFSEIQIGG